MAKNNFEILIRGGLRVSRLFCDREGQKFEIDFEGELNPDIIKIETELSGLRISGESVLVSIKPKNIEVSCKPAGAGADSDLKR